MIDKSRAPRLFRVTKLIVEVHSHCLLDMVDNEIVHAEIKSGDVLAEFQAWGWANDDLSRVEFVSMPKELDEYYDKLELISGEILTTIEEIVK